MGIDNTATLIFGTEIDYETVEKIITSFSLESNYDDFENLEHMFLEKYHLFIIRTSPYYDSSFEDGQFFISMIDDCSEKSFSELKEVYDTHLKDYKTFLDDLKMNSLKFNDYYDPKIMAVPHIY